MRKFDYSFLDHGMIPARLVNLSSNIASLKTMAGVRKEEYARIFTELESVAKIQSVKSSNAIEGIVTSDERIAAIVNHNSAPLNHDESEIDADGTRRVPFRPTPASETEKAMEQLELA